MSERTLGIGCASVVVIGLVLYMIVGLVGGGHFTGSYTHIDPGNVGLVLDTYTGNVETHLMSAGMNYAGPWEDVIEVPTVQRTINLAGGDSSGKGSVKVNTASNMLTVDVSCQYHVVSSKARDLYGKYQDQFEDLNNFENVFLEPSIKEAINYAIGDMDTATALTTVGKQQAEVAALKALNDEWEPQGIEFSQFMIRGIAQDDASQQLMSSTLSKTQDIQNAQISLLQQVVDNQKTIQQAKADAQINQCRNSTLTDLYVQDTLLGKVKTIYLNSNEIMGALTK